MERRTAIPPIMPFTTGFCAPNWVINRCIKTLSRNFKQRDFTMRLFHRTGKLLEPRYLVLYSPSLPATFGTGSRKRKFTVTPETIVLFLAVDTIIIK